MDGWMDRWVGVKAVLSIAYCNQKISCSYKNDNSNQVGTGKNLRLSTSPLDTPYQLLIKTKINNNKNYLKLQRTSLNILTDQDRLVKKFNLY